MKIYIKEDELFSLIFDTNLDSKKIFYYTTSSNLQEVGCLEFYINKKIKKVVSLKALPPAKKDVPSIKIELIRLGENRVELLKSYFHHKERELIELSATEIASSSRTLIFGSAGLILLLIITIPTLLYAGGFFQKKETTDKTTSTEQTKKLEETEIAQLDIEKKKEEVELKTKEPDSSELTSSKTKEDSTLEDSTKREDESKKSKEELLLKENAIVDKVEDESKKETEERLNLLKEYTNQTSFYFKKDLAVLREGEEIKLNRLIELLKESKVVNLRVEGHSAYIGLPDNEERISKARAETVKKYLLRYSGLELNITIAYFGSRKPVDHTSDIEEERKVNRRARVIIVDQ